MRRMLMPILAGYVLTMESYSELVWPCIRPVEARDLPWDSKPKKNRLKVQSHNQRPMKRIASVNRGK